ncbi:MAG: ribonuclease E/G [Robiginitomaculum sp.]
MKIILQPRIGETRAAIFDGKKCVELHLSRDSEARRAHPGDVYSGRIRSVDSSLSAAFVDLGEPSEPQGFLNFSLAPGAPKFREGQMVRVSVAREAEERKGPILSFIEMSDAEDASRERGGSLKSRLLEKFPDAEVAEGEISGFDAAIERDVALKGGGSLSIEPTRAVCAIDVDTGLGGSKKTVSLAAAKEVARQVRLRGIGGLILIDFPNMRQKKDRDDIWRCLVDNFDNDPFMVKIAPMSRFGTVEISRTKPARSLMAMSCDRYGQATPETTALRGLAMLEAEGRASGGAQLELSLPKPAHDWLETHKQIWQDGLTDRLGARFKIAIADSLHVSRDRP